MPKIEIKPDSTNESLEQSAEKVTKDGVDTDKDITVNADATSATVTEKEVQEEAPISESVRPDWLPEKFKDAEELAKAYGELEKQFSSRTQEEVKPEPTQKVSEQGMVLDTYYDEFAKDGSLSEKSYQALEKTHGLSKELVDGYIEGQKAIGDAHTQTVHDTVGGKEKYAELLDWAGKNLSEKEQTAFNKIVDGGNIDEAKFAVQGLMTRAGMVHNPKQPELFEGTSDVPTKDSFESVRQVTDAMQDARYDKDPAYRKKVTDKLARSTVI